MLVPLSSIFRRVKTVLSFRKSRVFSRTRFQFSVAQVGFVLLIEHQDGGTHVGDAD